MTWFSMPPLDGKKLDNVCAIYEKQLDEADITEIDAPFTAADPHVHTEPLDSVEERQVGSDALDISVRDASPERSALPATRPPDR
jgi:hypothetical protein